MAGQIVIFEHDNFEGKAQLIGEGVPRLGGKISSFVVITGKWQFFERPDFQMPYAAIFGPGGYPRVEDAGLPNDAISSLKAVA